MHKITREDQDNYAIRSYANAAAALKAGRFAKEIVGVPVPQKKGDPIVVTQDDEVTKGDPKKIPGLRSAFKKDGMLPTWVNACSVSIWVRSLV